MEDPRDRKVTLFASKPRTVAIRRILIVEPAEVVRAGLSSMARSVPFITSVVTCDGPSAALQLLRDEPVDGMLLSDRFGAAPTALLREEAASRGIRYLVMLQSDDIGSPDETFEMINYGALDLTAVTRDVLANSLSCLGGEHAVMPVSLLRTLLSRPGSASGPANPQSVLLTPRERQILKLLADGQSNKQIARRMGISEHGAKRHIANMLAKLNCPNRTQAVSVAIRAGWFTAAEDTRQGATA